VLLSRLPCWQCRLSRFLSLRQRDPFAYGKFDCCLFAANAIQEMTGTDIAAYFRGRYSSRKEALALVKDYVGRVSIRLLTEKVATEHGMRKVSILTAQRGDLILIQRSRDYSLGIVDLSGSRVAVLGSSGIGRIALRDGSRAWRV
jgi:hypothetical protein